MSHERLKHLKESLMTCVESQMCNIYEADTAELGEAIDMLKDLEEALYYCTITEAMEKGGEGKRSHEGRGDYEWNAQGMGDYGKGHNGAYDERGRSYMMYNDGRSSGSGGGYSGGGGNSNGNSGGNSGGRSYMDGNRPEYDYMNQGMNRDYREGRSPEIRRMYMEARDMGKDKTVQIKELEHYMQELSTDIVEMIQEAGADERQYLEKKLLALASKIGQMK